MKKELVDLRGVIDEVCALVEPEANALGFDLVRVHLFGAGDERTLQIMAERPETGQLVIEDCAALSHRISDAFDALEEAGTVLIEEAYRLIDDPQPGLAVKEVEPALIAPRTIYAGPFGEHG